MFIDPKVLHCCYVSGFLLNLLSSKKKKKMHKFIDLTFHVRNFFLNFINGGAHHSMRIKICTKFPYISFTQDFAISVEIFSFYFLFFIFYLLFFILFLLLFLVFFPHNSYGVLLWLMLNDVLLLIPIIFDSFIPWIWSYIYNIFLSLNFRLLLFLKTSKFIHRPRNFLKPVRYKSI